MLLEEALLQRYPPAFLPDDEVVEDRPAMVRDVRGRHLAWYLPGAMSEGLQASSKHTKLSLELTIVLVRIECCSHWKIFVHTSLHCLQQRGSLGEMTKLISRIRLVWAFRPEL